MHLSIVAAPVVLMGLMTSMGLTQDTPKPAASICLAPVQDDGSDRGYFSEKFAVRVDHGSWHPVPVHAESPQLIPGLDIQGKHLIVIRDGEKQIESFWFDFDAEQSQQLCLWYNEWYRTWSLTSVEGRGATCRCAAAETTR